MNPQLLQDLVTMKMPFGKYKGRILCELPESYLIWFQKEGYPPGKLGELIATLYEIKLNGLEYLLQPLKKGRF
ncbi:DNA polymerase III subunit epsilon [compost metagenome]